MYISFHVKYRLFLSAFEFSRRKVYLNTATDLPLDFVSSSSSPLKVRRLMSRLPVLIRAIVMLI